MAIVKLPAGTFVNLYTASGITVGTQIEVTNLTPDDARLFSTANEPANANDDFYPCKYRLPAVPNDSGDPGAWGWSLVGGALEVSEV